MFNYPLPSYAASIWKAGDILSLALPPTEPEGRGHMVKLEVHEGILKNLCADAERLDLAERKTLSALFQMICILHEREAARFKPTIVTKAAPVQYDLDKMIAAMGGKVTRIEKKKDAPGDLRLEDLGL